MTSLKEAQEAVLELDAIPEVVALLTSTNIQIQISAARSILNITAADFAQVIAIDAGALPWLVDLIKSTNIDVKIAASRTLEHIASGSERGALDIGRDFNVVQVLIGLLDSEKVQTCALETLERT